MGKSSLTSLSIQIIIYINWTKYFYWFSRPYKAKLLNFFENEKLCELYTVEPSVTKRFLKTLSIW